MKSKILVKAFIASESFFFITLILAYLYLGAQLSTGPDSVQSLHVGKKAVFTGFLLASSFTMWMARRGFMKEKWLVFKSWLGGTLVLGILFMYGTFTEYKELMVKDQMFFSRNIFASNFYILTGFHGIHVMLGLVILFIVFGLMLFGDPSKMDISAVESAEIYWHFVDGVWIFVFFIVYILPLFIHH